MIKFFILAGGKGTRARPLSEIKPKVLFPIDGIPLLEHILHNTHQAGCRTGFINIHHQGDQILRKITGNPNLTPIPEKKLSGNLILKQVLPELKDSDHLLIINGDVLTSKIPLRRMARLLREQDGDGVILAKSVTGAAGYNCLIVKGGYFSGRMRGEPEKVSTLYTGIALLKKKVLEKINSHNMFDSFEQQHLKILTCNLSGFWLDIGDPASYYYSNYKYKKFHKNRRNNSVSPGCSISAVSDITGSIIWERVSITNSILKNCIITNDLSLDSVCFESEIVYQKKGEILSHPINKKIID